MKLQRKKIAYCFLVSNERRDFYLLIPIMYFLEKYLNYEVRFEFVWDAYIMYKKQPDLVILPNTRGHDLYVEIGTYCVENNIPLFSHDSEGNFNTEIDYDYWAFNTLHKSLCPVIMTWNERVKQFLIDRYELREDQLVVTGSPIFDKYQYLRKKDKIEFLRKYNQQDKQKIIGYAGWAFGKLENKEIDDILSNINKPGEEGKRWLSEQRDQVEFSLKTIIEAYPDYLFVLKKHPRENFESDLRDSRNEMNRLVHYPNVLYFKDGEEIQDLIEVSDLWMAFESTSIMEAWLLNKPTVLINPDPDFVRASLHIGSLKIKNTEELIDVMQSFEIGNLAPFNDPAVITERKRILKDAVGFTDGKNHLRAIKAFLPYLRTDSPSQQTTFNFIFFVRYVLLHVGKWFFVESIFKRLPKFKKTVWLFKNRTLSEIKKSKKVVYTDLDSFYENAGIKKSIESDTIWSELTS